jgi:hypothetical protein
MPPFLQHEELVRDLSTGSETSAERVLPGQPCVALNNAAQLEAFLRTDIYAADLEKIAPHLWIMTTPSSGNIEALHRQRVKGREIILTEEPRLHLVWLHNRIFIKPLPRYLLSHTFWKQYLDESSDRLCESHGSIRKAATGFLRSYRYLIRHETDFNIAREIGLIPKDVDWPTVCRFVAALQGITDAAVSERYCFGELRLTRLNFYAPFLLRKFHFEKVHGQYGAFFARLYGPILFAFAVVSTMLSAMQVALAAEQLVTVNWVAIWYISRWFSVLSLAGTAVIAGWFITLWLYMFLDEWIYTLRQKAKRRHDRDARSKC